MANLQEELNRFPESGSIRITMDSDGIRSEPYEPLTVDDIDDFDSMDLENLDQPGLEDLLDKAEDLRDDLEDDEPEDEDSEEYNLWAARLSETEDFIDRIQARINELEDSE